MSRNIAGQTTDGFDLKISDTEEPERPGFKTGLHRFSAVRQWTGYPSPVNTLIYLPGRLKADKEYL